MSDHTSQPSVKYCADKMSAKYIHGRPEPELVPSRYALKVGEIDVMVVGILNTFAALARATTLFFSVCRSIDCTPNAICGCWSMKISWLF